MRAVVLLFGVGSVPGSVVAGFRMSAGSVVFVELLGAVRAFEFMAFAGDSGEGGGHDEQGKTFHRGAS